MLVLTGIPGFAAQASLYDRPDPHEIATSLTLPGKGGWTTCVPFSNALYKRLSDAGFETHYLVYAWKTREQRGQHALVIYKAGDGRYWAMDNRMENPRWVRGTDVASWLSSLKVNMDAAVVAHTTNRQPPPATFSAGAPIARK